jgi:predicted permease
MNEFYTVLTAVLPVFCIAVAGVIMRKVNWLTEEADHSLLKLTINVLSPALIFDSILKNEALKQPSNLLLPPVVAFSVITLGVGLGLYFGKLIGFAEQKVLRTFAVCIGIFNYGYIPVPLVTSLFGRETLGVLFVHNIGVEIAFWTVGVAAVSGTAGKGWKQFFTPPVIAILIALPLNFLNAHEHLPNFVLITARMLGQCAVPIGIILVGAMTADNLHEFHSAGGWKTAVSSCALRLALMPALFMLLAKFLPCSRELKQVIIVQGAMPTATFVVILARHYGGDASTAVRCLITTSAMSLVTIPLWIRLGMKFVGL